MTPLLDHQLDPDPARQFDAWHAEARTDEMAVATVRPDGAPACRMVLLKGHEGGRFVFYTDQRSDKAVDLGLHPEVALLFRWPPLRQVRVEGRAAPVGRAETEAYWRTRPRASQLSAWASHQSHRVQDRSGLEAAVARRAAAFEGAEVPCPPYWGGYAVVARRYEFWQQGDNRLHDRFRYQRGPRGWLRLRLGP